MAMVMTGKSSGVARTKPSNMAGDLVENDGDDGKLDTVILLSRLPLLLLLLLLVNDDDDGEDTDAETFVGLVTFDVDDGDDDAVVDDDGDGNDGNGFFILSFVLLSVLASTGLIAAVDGLSLVCFDMKWPHTHRPAIVLGHCL